MIRAFEYNYIEYNGLFVAPQTTLIIENILDVSRCFAFFLARQFSQRALRYYNHKIVDLPYVFQVHKDRFIYLYVYIVGYVAMFCGREVI